MGYQDCRDKEDVADGKQIGSGRIQPKVKERKLRYSEMATSETKPGIKEAVGLTTQTIDCRAARYRNTVIALVTVTLITLVWAGIQLSWRPLVGFLLLIPLCGTLLYLDTRLVNRWQQQIMQMWIPGHVQLKTLFDVMLTIKTLPAGTLKSMLETLPTSADGTPESPITLSTREAISKTVDVITQCQGNRTLFVMLALSLCVAFLALAALQLSWLPLLGLVSILPVIWISKLLNSFQLKHWKKKIREMGEKKEFDIKSFLNIANQLNWEAISNLEKTKLLNSLN
jgi:hypothetical protein